MNFFKRFLTLTLFFIIPTYLAGCEKTRISSSESTAPSPVPPQDEKAKKKPPPASLPAPKGKEPSSLRERTWFVSADRLHLRACAGLNCLVVTTLTRGEELFQTGEKGEWIRVRVKTTKKEGWVSPQFLGKEPPPAGAGPPPPD